MFETLVAMAQQSPVEFVIGVFIVLGALSLVPMRREPRNHYSYSRRDPKSRTSYR
jgi:hypothetical protein